MLGGRAEALLEAFHGRTSKPKAKLKRPLNRLNGERMIVYLAGPIDLDQGRSGVLVDQRAEARRYTKLRGWAMFDPSTAFTIGSVDTPLRGVQYINYAAIEQSDCVLALLPRGVPTIGTPMEIQYALDRNIPVFIVTDRFGWTLIGTVATWCETVSGAFEAMDSLQPFGAGDPRLLLQMTSDNAVVPTRAYSGDAGMDLYASESVEIAAGGFEDVPLGIRIAIPAGYFGRIVSRSSTFRRRRLDVREGIIDPGYRGELFAGVHNMSGEAATVECGERVAQMLLHEVPSIELIKVDELPESERSSRGFGSSGT